MKRNIAFLSKESGGKNNTYDLTFSFGQRVRSAV